MRQELEKKTQSMFNIVNLRAGQSPPVVGFPGSLAENSMIPPVMQNLFHPCTMADCTFFLSI